MRNFALMFHEIYPDGEEAYLKRSGRHPGNLEWAISDANFDKLLEALKQLGLASAGQDINSGKLAAGEDLLSVILTFDDGGVSAWEYAAPLLEKHHYRGFFFVCTGLIDSPGYLSREQLRDLVQRGHVIGSHTITHPVLTSLSDKELTRELQGSRQWLENLLGRDCSTFAIPGGFVDHRVRKRIREIGYKIVFTSDIPLPFGAFDEGRIGRWYVRPWWSEDILKSVYCRRLLTIGPMILRQGVLELSKRLLGYEQYLKVSKTVKKYITRQPD